MDKILEQRWQTAAPPFDGDCLHLGNPVRLKELRTFLVSISGVLQRTRPSALFRFDDWHVHDGFVTQRSSTDWDAINKVLSDDESLYAARQGDDYVQQAIYPDDLSFLLRFYVLDDEEVESPGSWGTCDLCGPSALIESVQNSSPESVSRQFVVSNAKEYFDGLYAG